VLQWYSIAQVTSLPPPPTRVCIKRLMQYVRNKALFDRLSLAAENEDKAQKEELCEEDMQESEDTNFSASGHHLRQHLNTDCTISSAADIEITAVTESGYHQLQQKDASMIPTEQGTGPFVTLHMMRRLRLSQTTNSNDVSSNQLAQLSTHDSKTSSHSWSQNPANDWRYSYTWPKDSSYRIPTL